MAYHGDTIPLMIVNHRLPQGEYSDNFSEPILSTDSADLQLVL